MSSSWQVDTPSQTLTSSALLSKQSARDLASLPSGQFETYSNPPSVWPAFLTGQEANPVRVLLVDDDPHIRLVIAQELMADARTLLVAQAGSVREGRKAITVSYTHLRAHET